MGSLRARLVVLVLVATAPALALAVWTGREHRRLAAAAAYEAADRIVRQAAASQAQLLEGAEGFLAALTRLPALSGGDPAACSRLLADLHRGYGRFTNVSVVSLRGDVLCAALPLAQPVNVADRGYFQRALAEREFVVGELAVGRSSGKASLFVAHPVLDAGGAVRVVLTAGLDLGWLYALVAEARLPAGSTLSVVDDRGTVAVRHPDPDRWVGRSAADVAGVRAMLARGGSGVLEAAGFDGIWRLFAFTELSPESAGRAYVAVGIPRDVALAEADRALRRNLLGLLGVGLVALALAWLVGSLTILRPARALLTAARRLGRGDLAARTGLTGQRGELGDLARAFDDMAAALERQAREREGAETTTRALAALGRELSRSLDPREVGERVAAGALDVLGARSVILYRLEGDALAVLTAAGPLREKFPAGWTVAADVGASGVAIRERRAFASPDVLADPALVLPETARVFLRKQGEDRAVLAAPLVVEGRVLGALVVVHETGHAYPEAAVAVAQAFADQAALALENARLYQEAEDRRREAASERARVAGILARVTDGFVALDTAWRYTYVNEQAAALFGRRPEDLLGKHIWTEFPEGVGQPFYHAYRRAVAEQVPVEIEEHYAPWDRWFENRVYPSPDGLSIFFREVTERKRAEAALQRSAERLQALRAIDQGILTAESPAEIARAALRHFRRLVGAPRAVLALFDPAAGEAVWLAVDVEGQTALPAGARFPLEMVGDLDALRRGEIQVVPDVGTLAHLRQPQVLLAEGVRSYVVIPLVAHGELIGSLNFGAAEPGGPPAESVEIGRELAGPLAVAIRQARLLTEVRQHAEALEGRVVARTAELREANAALDAFAYSVAHDLRAPLRAMQGFAQALLEDQGDRLDAEGLEFARRILAAAGRMDTLVQDLLAYSRLTRVDLERGPVDLARVVDGVLAQLGPEIQARGARVTVEGPVPAVTGHAVTLEQVLANLVTNAVKFVAPGVRPEVRIRAEPRDGQVRLSVEDNGIGIAPEHAERVFRVFERLHGSEAYPGTGIGLAIVQKGVERMGGRVGLESEPGRGSRFWVELPRASDLAVPPGAAGGPGP